MCGSGNPGRIQNFDWRRQALGVRIGRLLNLPHDLHPLDDPPKGGKPLAIGVAPAAEVGCASTNTCTQNRSRRSPAVQRFTASVTRGEKIALMGRNGAAKTTLIQPGLAVTAPRRSLAKSP